MLSFRGEGGERGTKKGDTGSHHAYDSLFPSACPGRQLLLCVVEVMLHVTPRDAHTMLSLTSALPGFWPFNLNGASQILEVLWWLFMYREKQNRNLCPGSRGVGNLESVDGSGAMMGEGYRRVGEMREEGCE